MKPTKLSLLAALTASAATLTALPALAGTTPISPSF